MTSADTAADRAVAALDGVVGSLPGGGGERREGQREMASLVAETIDRKGHAVVQAGTGTGKSLAYLVPALLAGQRTVIATATKALQDQLATKDLPFVVRRLGVEVDYAVLKGRSNYLCRQRLDEALGKSPLALEELPLGDGGGFGRLSMHALQAVARFSEHSSSGDRADLPIDMGDRAWRSLSVSHSECPGVGRCPHGRDCFAERARAKAARADVVIVNLHLYALSLLFPGIIDDHDLVVIDEAHQLEEAVSSALGRWVAPARFTALARSGKAMKVDGEACKAVDEMGKLLQDRLKPLAGRRLSDPLELMDVLVVATSRVARLAGYLQAKLGDAASAGAPPNVQRALMSARALLEDVNALRAPDDNDIIWVDGSTAVPTLRTTPLRVDELLAESLWRTRAAVLTSATIPPALPERVGLPESTVSADVGSPFDYRANALLYCPRGLPGPGGSDRTGRRLDELEALITAARGRTLALYTSYSAMHAAAEAMRNRIRWPVLVQGTKSKAALLEEFASDEHSCLFATLSFWQGVDVPGRSCSLVVIDRLPFPRPDDPVLQARRELVGPNAFRTIDLPLAATLLTQGAGRLIRTARDRGVVAVLDPRLATRSYRHTFTGALPPMRRSIERREAVDFLRAATSDHRLRPQDG